MGGMDLIFTPALVRRLSGPLGLSGPMCIHRIVAIHQIETNGIEFLHLLIHYTVYMVYLAVVLIWWFGKSCRYRQIKLGCKHGFLSIQYSKLPINNLANCILE